MRGFCMLEQGSSYLKVFCLASLLLWVEKAGFCWDFMPVPSGISRLQDSPGPIYEVYISGIYDAKKTQGTHWCVVPCILGSLAGVPSTLYHPESSYFCFIYNVSRFQLYLVGQIGRSMSASLLSQNLDPLVQLFKTISVWCFKLAGNLRRREGK